MKHQQALLISSDI